MNPIQFSPKKVLAMKHIILPLLALMCSGVLLMAQKPVGAASPWRDLPAADLRKPTQYEPTLPTQFRLLELDFQQMEQFLTVLSPDFSGKDDTKQTLDIELPMPDGGVERFRIFSDPIMHPDLAVQYPEIRVFGGQGIDDPTATIRMDLTPHGFNAQVLSDRKPSVYIAPVAVGDAQYHMSYFKKDNMRQGAWTCSAGHVHNDDVEMGSALKSTVGTCGSRREYRLALACTGEYASFHGGTVALALAAMNTSMNRVNGVYQRDCSVRMNIIPTTSAIIYLDGATDPYTNDDGGMMLGENQTNIDAVIGPANYDIGHVFSTGGGGIAGLGVVCGGSKAWGVTGSGAPIGDYFDIDYVAHEFGHQFAGDHTFNDDANGSCAGNLAAAAAYEPGSGSTIMSYAGICGPVDVQPNSDDYFHAFSLQQIVTFVQAGGGSSCGTVTPIANALPTVNAGADYTIPRSTPFRLTAQGSDPDGNAVRYCWEQMDNQLILHPPASTAPNGPVFRSFNPTVSPTRYFPNLTAVLNGTSPTWEVLPSVGRTMNFRVTARDMVSTGGCTEEDDMIVNVAGTAGPFRVTSIGTDQTCLFADDNTTITWDVANTTAAPVNCANVDIWLSLDGGQNFNILLAGGTPNDGSQSVAIPATAITQQGRIMVAGTNNVFFNVNTGGNIKIDCPRNLVVTANPVSGTYRVREELQTSGPVVVQPGTTAKFFAGDRIRLRPGFRALTGSSFLARIESCNPCIGASARPALAENTPPVVRFYEDYIGQRSNNSNYKMLFEAQVFPNPFDQTCSVRFDMPADGTASVQLFDLTGRLVQDVWNNQQQSAGFQLVQIDAQPLPSGTYVCRIVCNGQQVQLKLIKF
jgi:hypothetical protein